MPRSKTWSRNGGANTDIATAEDYEYLRKHMPPPLEKTVERFVTAKLPGLETDEKATVVSQLAGAVRGVFCDEISNNGQGVNALMSDLIKLHKRERIDLTDSGLKLTPISISRLTHKHMSEYRSDNPQTASAAER